MSSIKARRDLRYVMSLAQAVRRPRYWPSFVVLALVRGIAALPLTWQRGLGGVLGRLWMAANPKRRAIVDANLALCFPDVPPSQRAAMRANHFLCAGRALLDVGFLAFAPKARVARATRIQGLEHFRAALDARRNVILLAPHVVGMNYGGSVLCREHPIFSMAKGQKDPVFNWLLDRARGRFGGRAFLRHLGLRPVVKGIRAGMPFYYLPDEDFGGRHSVFAPFFGVPTATLDTLGRLAELTEAVVIPCFTRLLPGGAGCEIILHAPLENFPSGDRDRDAARMNAAMEHGIRPMPEQYMWTLKLFKTRPDDAPSIYH